MRASDVRLGSVRGVVMAALLVLAFSWPLYGNQVKTAFVKDDSVCPHSGDFPAASGDPASEAQILCLLNKERSQHGLPPLGRDARLDRAARAHSEDIAARDFFAHVNPDGVTPQQRIQAAGYALPTTGENIAWGEEYTGTPVEIVKGWMNSPGHRENILRPTFTQIGIGVTRGAPQESRGRAAIYTTTFGGPAQQPPARTPASQY